MGSIALDCTGIGLIPGTSTGVARTGMRAFDNVGDYLRVADKLDVSTAPSKAVFYSGRGNRELAETFAKQSGKTTLEMTPGGRWLDQQKLFGSDSPLTRAEARQVWSILSKRYADEASGTAIGFVKGSTVDSIFNTVEYDALIKNANIENVLTGGF